MIVKTTGKGWCLSHFFVVCVKKKVVVESTRCPSTKNGNTIITDEHGQRLHENKISFLKPCLSFLRIIGIPNNYNYETHRHPYHDRFSNDYSINRRNSDLLVK